LHIIYELYCLLILSFYFIIRFTFFQWKSSNFQTNQLFYEKYFSIWRPIKTRVLSIALLWSYTWFSGSCSQHSALSIPRSIWTRQPIPSPSLWSRSLLAVFSPYTNRISMKSNDICQLMLYYQFSTLPVFSWQTFH